MKPLIISTLLELHQTLEETSLTSYDIGNSQIKVGSFERGKLLGISKSKELEILPVHEGKQILCSVRKNIQSSFKWNQGDSHFLGAPIQYEKSLGHDRLVCSAHLYQVSLLLDKPIILLDLGTFITAEFINKEGHLGGYIFPGVEVFLKSYGSGQLLPRLSKKDPGKGPDFSWPRSTENAIRGAAELFLKGLADQFNQLAQETNSLVLLTGGSSELIQPYFPDATQIEVFEELIHYSLYFTHSKIANP